MTEQDEPEVEPERVAGRVTPSPEDEHRSDRGRAASDLPPPAPLADPIGGSIPPGHRRLIGTGIAVPPGPPISRLWYVTTPIAVAIVLAALFLLLRSSPYVVFVPGSATAVEPLIEIGALDGGEMPELDEVGENILFTTVSIEYPTGALVLRRTVDDNADIAPSEQYFGRQSLEENRRYNEAQMVESKDKAVKVALEVVGYEVEVDEVGSVLLDVDPDYPAAAVLHPGDTITAVDGAPVRRTDDLVDAIAEHEPGDEIELTLTRLIDGETETVLAPLAPHADDPARAQLGVSLTTRVSFRFPFDVSIDSGEVGGPSAGLAFTLALIDLLTPGELTGGERVAVTGTIDVDGAVGPVGGVRQKIEAAVREGAGYFLVPPHETEEAIAAADGRLEIIEVATIDDALDALHGIGGDPVEPVAAGR